MKKFLIKTVVFFALAAVLDVCFGIGLDSLRNHAKDGATYKNNYIAELCVDDVLILGSSRAANHYLPAILSDSLKMSCYNAGQTGCGIIPAYANYKMVAERHLPRLVIYEVTPKYDYLVGEDYSKYVGSIRPYADKPAVAELFSVFLNPLESIKQRSGMYRNNSGLIRYLLDQKQAVDMKGFEFLYGTLQSTPDKEPVEEPLRIDSLKYMYFKKLVSSILDDGVTLVFVISPMAVEMLDSDMSVYEPAFQLAHELSVPVISFLNDDRFVGQLSWFSSVNHLNFIGAEYFSRCLVPRLRPFLP